MSYEINIISVGQQEKSDIHSTTDVLLRDELSCDDVRRYFRIWPVFCHTNGILYSIGRELQEGYFSSFSICDADFENKASSELLPDFITKEVRENLTPLIIFPQYYSDVENFVRALVQASPQKTILFLARYEGGDHEIFSGTFPLSQFLQRLKTNQILFNVCYIVTDDEMYLYPGQHKRT